MGSRGPRPKTSFPVAFAPGVPEPSDRLTEPARVEYVRVASICKDARRELQQVDAAVLEVYAQSWADFWRLDADIRAEGEVFTGNNGILQKNPKCGLRESAWKQLLAAAAKLGFSPADRARVSDGSKGSKAPNPLDQFI